MAYAVIIIPPKTYVNWVHIINKDIAVGTFKLAQLSKITF